MLTPSEIKKFLDDDAASLLKRRAKEGQRYYEGEHDILQYRVFYYNADGKLVEDTQRANFKIPHAFFTELVEQGTQYVMSGQDSMVRSDDPKLQAYLDEYFDMRFMSELEETITGIQAKGFGYMYAYKKNGKLMFENADCLGVIEVEGRFAEDGKDQYIYKFMDVVDKNNHKQWKIRVIDDAATYYYRQEDNGAVVKDPEEEMNPRPHDLYKKDGMLFKKDMGFLPMFRLDYNKKRISLLKPVKALIDDYDLMASSLTNNLVDFDTPIHVIKGFQGDNLDQLQQNLKTKKLIGVDDDGGLEVHTVDIPYEARKEKLELDEKNIYRFGMGLNMLGLKDTTATTNMTIKAAYSLLDLRCSKIIRQVKLFLEQIVEVVIAEINKLNNTNYQKSQVYFSIVPETIVNAQENAQIALTEAQKQQIVINTLLALADRLDDETMMQLICEQLDLDYEAIKDKLPNPDESLSNLIETSKIIGGDLIE